MLEVLAVDEGRANDAGEAGHGRHREDGEDEQDHDLEHTR